MNPTPPTQFLLGNARRIAECVVEELIPFCERIEIAGSIRRQRPLVGDIDLVLLPKPDLRDNILVRCGQSCKKIKQGEQYVVFEMATGLQLDLWFAHRSEPEEKDMLGEITKPARPGNFGTLLLCRTGSKEHNIYMAQRALSLGMNWNPHHGVMQQGRCLASETEEAVFAALKLDFIPPERRER